MVAGAAAAEEPVQEEQEEEEDDDEEEEAARPQFDEQEFNFKDYLMRSVPVFITTQTGRKEAGL